MIRLHVRSPYANNDTYLCTATPDAPCDEDARWSPACFLTPGHSGRHEAADAAGDLLSEVVW